MTAALDVGMRQLVDERHLRPASEDRVDIHLLEQRSLVIDVPARNGFELGSELGDAFAAVSLDHADHHIFTPAVATDAFADHVEGLADTWSVAEKELKDALLLFGRCLFEPLFGRL